jgi:hypothetical protein
MKHILEQPLVSYAGLVTENGSITYYGHGDFMPVWQPSQEASLDFIKKFDEGKLYFIQGDLSNPYFNWPMYAVKS